MNIAERIKTIRKSASLGQQEFAKRLGTSQSTVSAFEKGDRKPDVEMAIHICDIFNANIQWLLLGSGPMYVDEKRISNWRHVASVTYTLIYSTS